MGGTEMKIQVKIQVKYRHVIMLIYTRWGRHTYSRTYLIENG